MLSSTLIITTTSSRSYGLLQLLLPLQVPSNSFFGRFLRPPPVGIPAPPPASSGVHLPTSVPPNVSYLRHHFCSMTSNYDVIMAATEDARPLLRDGEDDEAALAGGAGGVGGSSSAGSGRVRRMPTSLATADLVDLAHLRAVWGRCGCGGAGPAAENADHQPQCRFAGRHRRHRRRPRRRSRVRRTHNRSRRQNNVAHLPWPSRWRPIFAQERNDAQPVPGAGGLLRPCAAAEQHGVRGSAQEGCPATGMVYRVGRLGLHSRRLTSCQLCRMYFICRTRWARWHL